MSKKKTQRIYTGVITHVVDGDTLDVSIDLGFNVSICIRVRIKDVNAYELKDKDIVKAQKAIEAKEYLEQFVYKAVTLIEHGKDPYGRYVCDVIGDQNLGQSLLEKGLAVEAKY